MYKILCNGTVVKEVNSLIDVTQYFTDHLKVDLSEYGNVINNYEIQGLSISRTAFLFGYLLNYAIDGEVIVHTGDEQSEPFCTIWESILNSEMRIGIGSREYANVKHSADSL